MSLLRGDSRGAAGRRVLVGVLAAAVVVTVAGCGPDGSPAGTPTATSTASPTGAPSGAPTPSPGGAATVAPDDLTPSPGRGVTRTYDGVVTAGVEAGCRLLRTSSGAFVLVGSGLDRLPDGGRVTVRGTVDPGAVTVCNQGPVLRVTEVVSPTR